MVFIMSGFSFGGIGARIVKTRNSHQEASSCGFVGTVSSNPAPSGVYLKKSLNLEFEIIVTNNNNKKKKKIKV